MRGDEGTVLKLCEVLARKEGGAGFYHVQDGP